MDVHTNSVIAATTTRLLLGFIFFFQGYGKVFKWGIQNVTDNFFLVEKYNMLPDFLLRMTAYYTSFAELIFGAFLIIGFLRNWSLYFLASVLVIVTIGHGIAEPIWELSHVMYRAILLIASLIIPVSWDKWTLDMFLKNRNKN